ncbi:MAG: DUF2085 domain-containing protein [Clostridiales bacterium]|nr:DUF2085 domain-containing protein [Clostridiales bacterium]
MENVTPKQDKGIRTWLCLMELGRRLGCHQREDRSFSFRGYQFPVCARCTGVFFGQLSGIVMLLLGIRITWIPVAVLVGIMGLDWGIQKAGILESNNYRRLITGIAGGLGAMYVYFYVIRWLILLI